MIKALGVAGCLAILSGLEPPNQTIAQVIATRSLCTISFDRDRRCPARVDNEAKACLDDIGFSLQQDPAAKLVIVGHRAAGEPIARSQQRSVSTRQYLVNEKGVDLSRITLVWSGSPSQKIVSNVLVPNGAVYAMGTGESAVPTTVRVPNCH